jgi:hypothetical protein
VYPYRTAGHYEEDRKGLLQHIYSGFKKMPGESMSRSMTSNMFGDT